MITRVDPSQWLVVILSLCAACTACTACTADPSGDSWPCWAGNGQEVFDPYQHEVCLRRCSDALDCPRGSLCAKADEESANGFCALPTDTLQTSRRALLDGFGVEQMSATMVVEDAYELHWSRPPDASLVTCVLLSCPPAFRIPGDAAGEWLPPTESSRAVIANYHHCVIASEHSSQPEGSFSLRERDNQHEPPTGFMETNGPGSGDADCPEHAVGDPRSPGPHGCAPVTELLTGCWAYDGSSIVAATRLFSVDSREIYNYHDFSSLEGRCRPDEPSDMYRVCVLEESDQGEGASASAETPAYGLCVCVEPPCGTEPPSSPLECMRPCLSNCDCDDEQSVDGCEAPQITNGVCVGAICTSTIGG